MSMVSTQIPECSEHGKLFLVSFFRSFYCFVLFCFVFSVIHDGVIAALHLGVFILELLPKSYLDAYTEAIHF